MKMLGLAPYGGDEFFIALISCGAAAFALRQVHPLLMIVPAVPFAIVVWFFRDPERSGTTDENILISPADGTVTDIEELDESEFIRGRAKRIGIFLSPFNVHVNRVPCAGVVRNSRYKAGDFLPAYNPKAPEKNESISLDLETPKGLRLVIKQVTGVLARRIVCEAQHGETLARGQRYGMIKFGSRTEVYVPIEAFEASLVQLGDKVKGGQTPICKIRDVIATPATDAARERAQMLLEGAAMIDSSGATGEPKLSDAVRES